MNIQRNRSDGVASDRRSVYVERRTRRAATIAGDDRLRPSRWRPSLAIIALDSERLQLSLSLSRRVRRGQTQLKLITCLSDSFCTFARQNCVRPVDRRFVSANSQTAAHRVWRVASEITRVSLAESKPGVQQGFWSGGGPAVGRSTKTRSGGVTPGNILKNVQAI